VKKILNGILITAVALAALAAAALPAAASACASSPCADDLTMPGLAIRPGPDVAVFGIDLTGSNLTTVGTVHVDFAQVGADTTFDMSDLEASPDGVALWRDDSNSTPTTQDVLDPADTKLSTSFTTSGMRANLKISPAWHLPAASAAEGTYTLFLTIRLSSTVSDGDDFTVTLPSDAFQSNIPILGFNAVTSNAITADPTAPVVQWFAPAVLQTDNIYWQLSERVFGVGPSTVAFRLHGTTTDVPATVSFDDVSDRVIVHPTTPLMAGQSYDANLLPGGAGGIVDRAGNPLAPDSRSFRAATDVGETAYGTSYAWASHTTSSAYGGNYTANNIGGSTATYKFTGTSITWYTLTDPYQGKATVYIDNRWKGQVNNYAATAKYLVPRTYSGLTSGAHTILIRADGVKGSTSGRDTWAVVDAFKVGSTLTTNPVLTYTWLAVSNSNAVGGTYRASRLPGTSVTFAFRGTSIDWRTILGPGMGRAAVYIDGAYKGIVDDYYGATIYRYTRSFAGLSDGVHTIKILAAGRNTRATDSLIVVDGFDVDGI